MWKRKFSIVDIRNYSIAITNKQNVVNSVSKPDNWENAKPYESIPGPKPAPFIGNLWRFVFGELSGADFTKNHATMHKKFGDICAFRNISPLKDMVFLFEPKYVEAMFRNEGIYPIRDGFQSMAHYRNVIRKDIFGDQGSLMTSHGEKWHEVRTKVNPILMQPRTAQQYIHSMDIIASDFLERVKELVASNPEGEMPADFQNELHKWAFESIGMIALDRRLGCLDKHPNEKSQTMINYMVETFRLFFILDFTPFGPLFKKYNLPIWRRFIKYQDFFTNMSLEYINEAIERIKSDPDYANKPEHEKSAFERFIEKDKMIAVIMTLDMLGAGIDTTGKVTAAALYFLARHKDVQDKLRAELISALPKKDDQITKDVLENIPYVKAILKEVTRISPVTIGVVRQATKDLVIGGYQIPKGVNLVLPNLYLSLNEKNYNEPKKFIPERWLKSTEGELSHKNVNPFITLPFGFGPRSCIGKRLANLEMQIVIAKIIRNFELHWPHQDMEFGQDKLLYGIKNPLKIRMKLIKQ